MVTIENIDMRLVQNNHQSEEAESGSDTDDSLFPGRTTGQSSDLKSGSESKVTLYPNPARDWIAVSGLKEGNWEARVVDMQGKVHTTAVMQNGSSLPVMDLESGTYILRLKKDGDEDTITKRFVKH